MSKLCRGCGVEKPFSCFHKRGKGFQSRCKDCRSRSRNPQHYARSKRLERLAALGLKECSICKRELRISEFNKSKNTRDGLVYKCRSCSARINAEWRKRNPNGFREWYSGNRERRADYWVRWYAANKKRRADSYRAWARANPHVLNAIVARRNAAKIRATPAWADEGKIRILYERAAYLTKITGVRHEVDHIYPLQGKRVCGLHVSENLQILTRSQNARKRNKMPEELGPLRRYLASAL